MVWNRWRNRRPAAPSPRVEGVRPALSIPLEPSYLEIRYGFDDEEEIKRAVEVVSSHTMASLERLAQLWQHVRYLDRYGFDGCLVECGTWRGGCVGMMALAHMRSRTPPSRSIHLFDSFEGLPEPKADVDGATAVVYAANRASGALSSIGQCVASEADCRRLLEEAVGYPRGLASYHVGWFEHTVPAAAEALGRIALLRLDGDWYESTKTCLESLYPNVIEGGIVVIDDYGHWEGCRRAVDEFIDGLDEPVFLAHVDYTCRYWVRSGVRRTTRTPSSGAAGTA